MTVYTGVIGKNTLIGTKTNQPVAYRLNLTLFMAAVVLFMAYIFLANFLVTQKYSVELRKKEFRTISSSTANPKPSIKETSMEELLTFARSTGMVEAKDTDSIMQNRGFAVSP